MPVIGITTYSDNEKFYLPKAYVDCVRRAGGAPVLLPPGEAPDGAFWERIDGLILAGGGDVDPALYGGAAHAAIYGVDPARDRTEIALVRGAVERKVPALGICRGAQVINVALGGTLVEHIPDEFGGKLSHHRPPPDAARHAVELDADCRLAKMLPQAKFEAASRHHQAVRKVAGELRACGWAPDGVIEAVEMPGHPWLFGVQWHPELSAENPVQQRLFRVFVEAAGKEKG